MSYLRQNNSPCNQSNFCKLLKDKDISSHFSFLYTAEFRKKKKQKTNTAPKKALESRWRYMMIFLCLPVSDDKFLYNQYFAGCKYHLSSVCHLAGIRYFHCIPNSVFAALAPPLPWKHCTFPPVPLHSNSW